MVIKVMILTENHQAVITSQNYTKKYFTPPIGS